MVTAFFVALVTESSPPGSIERSISASWFSFSFARKVALVRACFAHVLAICCGLPAIVWRAVSNAKTPLGMNRAGLCCVESCGAVSCGAVVCRVVAENLFREKRLNLANLHFAVVNPSVLLDQVVGAFAGRIAEQSKDCLSGDELNLSFRR